MVRARSSVSVYPYLVPVFGYFANRQDDLVTESYWRMSCVLETNTTVGYACRLLNLLRNGWNDVWPSFEDI